MTLTQQQAKDWMPLIQALAEGKLETITSKGKWMAHDSIVVGEHPELYRRAPERRFIPWTMESFPWGCALRQKEDCVNRKLAHGRLSETYVAITGWAERSLGGLRAFTGWR